MTPAVRFDRVSKKFRLDFNRPRSLQEMFVQRRIRAEADYFWALHDISFTIEPGEHVGLIGTNGSGKSTLLKLISRVIQPTSGTLSTHGRVAGLLELGTGFHPDLTGRENIFLNASILGISRTAIARQLDDIIDFADIGQFIDVPVRNYSSGMVVRLGFAITTALQPEVLLIDEVLAVGDQNFQRKCITRLEDLQTQGVTLLLVSHGLGQIRELCDRAIWISQGTLKADGDTDLVAGEYTNSQIMLEKKLTVAETTQNRFGTRQAEITRVELLRADGTVPVYFRAGETFRLRMYYRAPERIEQPTFGLAFYRRDGVHVNGPNSVREGYEIPYLEGTGCVEYQIEQLPLNPGRYELTVAIYNTDSTVAIDHHHRLYPFEVRSQTDWNEEGVVHIPARWQHRADRTG
ncbi:MAG: ABC transporter ATP-binding protein [Thermoflexales bacterium]|nr:ABC transporter ATP-binding protein [Thermoflexales bacterium]